MTAAALLAAAAAGSMGCELIATVDRSKIPNGEGGSGGSTTSSTTSGMMDVCGDGMVTGAEACDDGNTTKGDGCDDTCAVETGWTCKDSPSTCTPTCGDGVVVGTEECDDQNTSKGDGCDDTCKVEPGFSCTGMPSTCTPGCGDGVIAGSEECDDGALTDGDGCDHTCKTEHGFTCSMEPSICTSSCGDGILASDEQCDDGANADGDGCDHLCKTESGFSCTGEPSTCASTCGDGIVASDEACDDKNMATGDGCDASCKQESGWTCTNMPGMASTCVTTCGDGIVAGTEQCDDGAMAAGDGCDGSCKTESGWTCTNAPGMASTCSTTCGDGIKAGTEECDDNNAVDLDGCSSTCKVDVFNETEPNDTAAQANGPYDHSVLIHGSNKPGPDGDWYKIVLPATADLSLETFDSSGPGSCANIDTVVTFLAADGTTVLASDDDAGINSCSKLSSLKNAPLRHLPAGTYFVKVEAFAGYQPVPGYTLEVLFDALCGDGKRSGFEQCDGTTGCAATCDRVPSCGDGFIDGPEVCDDGNNMSGDGCSSACQYEVIAEMEPNATTAQAGAFAHTPNVLVSGAISPATDVDWWAFVVPATADLKLETFDATGPGSCNGIDTIISLYGTDGTTLLVQRDQGGIGNCSRIDPALPSDAAAAHLPAGTYFVKVESHGAVIAGYNLLATFNALCGNGVVEGAEECEGASGCTATCDRVAVCGDGFVDGSETCDDGNNVSGDGCSSACALELLTESEPNDTTATADGPYSTHALIGGSISAGSDVDYYAIQVTAVSDIRIETFDANGPGSCDGGVDTVATLYDTDGTTIITQADDGGINTCSLIDPKTDPTVRQLQPGTYFVKVEDFNNDNIIPGYRVEISFTAVCGNGKVEGFEECDGTANCDTSCKRIPTCGDGFIDAPETCDDGNTGDNDGCDHTCKLESTAEVEPNNDTTAADASTVQLTGSGSVSGAIGAVGDKDFYKLTLAAGATIRFETVDGTGADCSIATTLRLWDSAATQIYSDDNSGISSCSALVVNLAAGTYYVSVEQQGNTAAIAAYTLLVSVAADGGAEVEPNDAQATASAVMGTDVFAIGDHSNNGDVDFFMINVPAGKSVRAEVIEGNTAETCESLGIDSMLTLYDSKGVAIDSDDDAGRGFCSLIDGTGSAPVNAGAHGLAGGVYYLAVEASPFAGVGTNPDGQFVYRLAVTIR